MKKFGFTLVEVMIALSIIGVVASLTIPTFVSETNNKANANKLATTVSTIENAFTSMIANEGVQDLSETAFASSPTTSNLSNYLKISGSADDYTTLYGKETPYRTISSSNAIAPSISKAFFTKNGAYLIYASSDSTRTGNVESCGGTMYSTTGHLAIDVNGNAKPNILGRDVFYFRVGYDGVLYPSGSLNYSILQQNTCTDLWNSSSSNYICTNSSKGEGCTARLIENNYEVDY